MAGMGLTQFPAAGYGEAPVPAPQGGRLLINGKPWNELSSGEKVIAGGGITLAVGLGIAIIGGLAWLTVQEVKLKKQIVERGGGEALMKYELGRAAGTFAGSLGEAIGGGRDRGFKKNKKKRRGPKGRRK